MNSLPKVKRFVKNLAGGDCSTCSSTGEHASLYPDLDVKWTRGVSPVLYVMHDGVKVKTIDLLKYGTDELHDLMIEIGEIIICNIFM